MATQRASRCVAPKPWHKRAKLDQNPSWGGRWGNCAAHYLSVADSPRYSYNSAMPLRLGHLLLMVGSTYLQGIHLFTWLLYHSTLMSYEKVLIGLSGSSIGACTLFHLKACLALS